MDSKSKSDVGSRFRGANIPAAICVALALIYCALFATNALTRFRSFSPDSMNYVDVARNLLSGRGLVQSAIGFNHPRFLGTQQWPEPFTAQPPLYPLCIAGVGLTGLEPADGSLVITAVCHAIILLLSARLAYRLGGAQAAFVCVAALVWFYPLLRSCRFAWSESMAVVFVLIVLAELASPDRLRSAGPLRWAALGLAAGLAFATRYAMAPLVVLAAGYCLAARRNGATGILFPSAAGAFAPAAAVLVHNLGASGHLLPVHNASNQPWTVVFGKILDSFCAQYADGFRGPTAWSLWIVATAAALFIFMRGGVTREHCKRWIPAMIWIAGYLLFIFVQRVRIHFDEIEPRLLLPALVPFVAAWSAALALKFRPDLAAAICALALAGATWREAQFFRTMPPVDEGLRDARVARNQVVRKLTTDRDVIIGNDPLGVVFYVRRPNVISFSKWPYTDAPDYTALVSFLERFSNRYENAYMMIRDVHAGNRALTGRDYGNFVADLLAGEIAAYPRIKPAGIFADTHVFTVTRAAP